MHLEESASLLEVEKLSVRYGGVRAVDEVTLSVREGQVVGLIGANGAGKTSLIDALTGYHPAAAGRVRFAGEDITHLRPHLRARRGLARTFQSVELFDDLTVEENALAAAEDIGVMRALGQLLMGYSRSRELARWPLSVVGLEDVADRLPSELSHGRRKLVGVARALARRPRLMLLDEPAAGLDTDESAELGRRMRTLPREGVTVLLVDHDMGLVLSVCDYVFVLDFGRLIAEGTPSEIRRSEAVIGAYLGSQEVARHASA
jgi:branched-chain amino acid transport system ATP-binding protein